MKKLFLIAAGATLTALQVTSVFASGDHKGQHVAQATAAAPAAAAASMTDGEVRKVDKGAKKITLKHAEIKSLGMPPMTMVFQVKDPAFLDKVKVGDKVQFTVEETGGAMVLTSIDMAK